MMSKYGLCWSMGRACSVEVGSEISRDYHDDIAVLLYLIVRSLQCEVERTRTRNYSN
jgi:hypothetical protein